MPIGFYHNIQVVQKHSLCIFFYSTVPAQNVSHFARRELKKHEINHYMMSLIRSLRARSPFGGYRSRLARPNRRACWQATHTWSRQFEDFCRAVPSEPASGQIRIL